MSQIQIDKLIKGVENRDRVLLAQAITLVESEKEEHREQAKILFNLISKTNFKAKRIGITGTPGVGKSTFISAFAKRLAQDGKEIAILAIDPSSVRSGGSILGDKTRMAEIANEKNIFIRPSASGTHLGGVAAKTRAVIDLCEMAKFDYVIVESVGVGQSEISLSQMVDCLVLIAGPNAGDELQGIKRGILEVVDMIVVNKADGDAITAANLAKVQLENALHILRSKDQIKPKSYICSSLNQTGFDEIMKGILDFLNSIDIDDKRKTQWASWLKDAIDLKIKQKVYSNSKVIKALNEVNRTNSLSVDVIADNLIEDLIKS